MPFSELIDEATAELSTRHEAVQARTAARISKLLDAASAVAVEVGIERLTTALVAEKAGASIGTVYRYFPDRIAILVALNARNMERLLGIANELLVNGNPANWSDAVDACITAMVEMHRTQPGFTSTRLGEIVAYPEIDPEQERARRFAQVLAGFIEQAFEIPSTPEIEFRLDLVIHIVDALLLQAFVSDKNGDERTIEQCRHIVRSYLVEVYGPIA